MAYSGFEDADWHPAGVQDFDAANASWHWSSPCLHLQSWPGRLSRSLEALLSCPAGGNHPCCPGALLAAMCPVALLPCRSRCCLGLSCSIHWAQGGCARCRGVVEVMAVSQQRSGLRRDVNWCGACIQHQVRNQNKSMDCYFAAANQATCSYACTLE